MERYSSLWTGQHGYGSARCAVLSDSHKNMWDGVIEMRPFSGPTFAEFQSRTSSDQSGTQYNKVTVSILHLAPPVILLVYLSRT